MTQIMFIDEEEFAVHMVSGRAYYAIEMLSPVRGKSGQRNEFDILAVVVDTDPDGFCNYQLVDYVYGIDGMSGVEIWAELIETALKDDKRREEEENRK